MFHPGQLRRKFHRQSGVGRGRAATEDRRKRYYYSKSRVLIHFCSGLGKEGAVLVTEHTLWRVVWFEGMETSLF